MNYTIFRQSSRQPLDNLQLHVLARAYAAAWHAVRASEPTGLHVIDALDVAFVFSIEPADSRGVGCSADAAGASRSATCRSSAGRRGSGRSAARSRARR